MGTSFEDHKSFKDENFKHYVLYRVGDIVGTVQIQHIDETRASLCKVAIDEDHKGLGYGTMLLYLIEDILKSAGYRVVFLCSRLDTANFYFKNKYKEMHYIDDVPDKCITLGKFL